MTPEQIMLSSLILRWRLDNIVMGTEMLKATQFCIHGKNPNDFPVSTEQLMSS